MQTGRIARARTLTLLSAAAALILAAPPSIAAQSAAAQERPFPYVVSRRDAILLPAALGVSLLGDAVAPEPRPLTRAEVALLSPDDVNAFDRIAARSWSEGWATASDRSLAALLGAAVLVPFAPLAADGHWRDALTLGVMVAEAALLVEGTTYLAKDLAGRERPWTHNTSLSVEERLALSAADPLDARRSFFSGHTSSAFALATFMSTVYTDVNGRTLASDILWAASLSTAALTAFARVKAGMHYPTDVVAGAAVGIAVGRLVPALHRVDRSPPVRVFAGPGRVGVIIPLGGGRAR